MHSIKIESLAMKEEYADKIELTINNFLLELGFNEERIEALECRSRDGFIASSHNKGGLAAASFQSLRYLQYEDTGFKNTDKTIEEYYQYDLDCYKEQHGLCLKEELPEEHYESFDDYMFESDDTVMFSCDIMLIDSVNLNIRICIGAKDTPYHRQYDDLISIDINFKDEKDLERQFKEVIENNEDVQLFINNLEEAY